MIETFMLIVAVVALGATCMPHWSGESVICPRCWQFVDPYLHECYSPSEVKDESCQ